jgi:hypothetical protein
MNLPKTIKNLGEDFVFLLAASILLLEHLRVSLDFLFGLQMAKIRPNFVAKILM